MINIPKGTKDVLPKDSYKWQYIEEKARKVASAFGIKEIRTPIFEHTEVFLRGVGDTTDIVNKEMYTFTDKGGRSITLKPEGTSAVARSFIENGMANEALPVKLFYITPCFRYERPQAGRLRQFHQFGVEVFGSQTPDTDAEMILLAKTFLDEIGITQLTLNINSIGCKTCRAEYNKALKEYLKNNLDNMCEQCKERFNTNPLRILDCKNPDCIEINRNVPKILDYLCDDCKAHFESVKSLLDGAGVKYTVNPGIVRGLDYYTKTVFEFVSEAIGAQGTVCGGGRYDGLIEEMGGAKTCGVGFGLGIERLLLLMDNLGMKIPNDNGIKVYVAPISKNEYPQAFNATYLLRKVGVSAETDHMERSLKAQFKYADKLNAEYVAVIGEDEASKGVAKVKRMSDGFSEEVRLSELAEYFK